MKIGLQQFVKKLPLKKPAIRYKNVKDASRSSEQSIQSGIYISLTDPSNEELNTLIKHTLKL